MADADIVRELIERAPFVGFVKDDSGKYLYVNDAWLRLFGLTKEQVLGRDDFEIFPEEVAHGVVKNDRQVLEGGRSLEVLERAVVRDKERTYLSVRFPMVVAERLHLAGVSVDVSRSEADRSDLARSELRFRRLLEHSPEAIVVYDVVSGSFVEANDNACRLFGFPLEEMVKLSPADVSPPFQADGRSSLEVAGDHIQAALDGQFPVYDFMHQNADGELIPCRIWLARMDEQGAPWVRASIMDMREIDRARQALVETQSKLEQALRLESLGRLAGGIAHDFNNLLTIMVGSITFLSELADPPTELKEELLALREAALQARGLTHQLLAFAREPAGIARAVNVDQAVASAMGTLGRLVGENVTLSTHLDAGGAEIFVDPAQFNQIVLNLVVNAKEAVQDGGSIVVETSRSDDLDGPKVTLTVRDDGRGMSPEIKRKAFEPFFSTKGRGRGTGLGLATVYGIAQAAGGDARIESQRGKGTIISVVLPCYLGQRTPSSVPSEGPTKGEGCILVIEDEDAVRRVTTRMLRRAGYRVLEAQLPSVALELAEAESDHVTLIVSDVVMPEMNGFQLAEKLRQILPDVPALFVSGYPADAMGARESDAPVELLSKPFTNDELLARVRKVLASHHNGDLPSLVPVERGAKSSSGK